MKQAKVSVILHYTEPSAGGTISFKFTLDSILNQTHQASEIILISNGGTSDLFQQYEGNNISFQLLETSEQHSQDLKKAFTLCRNDHLLYLNNQQVEIQLKSGAIDLFLLAAEQEPDWGMIYADYEIMDSGKIKETHLLKHHIGRVRDNQDYGKVFLFNRKILTTVGIDESIEWNALYDLRLRISERAELVHIANKYAGSLYRVKTTSHTQNVFDYLLASRESQLEAEKVLQGHLRRICANLEAGQHYQARASLRASAPEDRSGLYVSSHASAPEDTSEDTSDPGVSTRASAPEDNAESHVPFRASAPEDTSEDTSDPGVSTRASAPEDSEESIENSTLKASIIIPVYDRPEFIGTAIESVLAQTVQEIEVIVVVNGGDNDPTIGAIEQYMRGGSKYDVNKPEVRLLVYDINNLGLCFNMGARFARGEYYVQLDSDDRLKPDAVEKILAVYEQDPTVGMVIGSYEVWEKKENGDLVRMENLPVITHDEWTEENGRNNLLRINGAGAPRSIPIQLIRDIGFSVNQEPYCRNYGEDYGMVLKISERHRIGRVWEAIYEVIRHAGGTDHSIDQQTIDRNDEAKDFMRKEAILRRINLNKNNGL